MNGSVCTGKTVRDRKTCDRDWPDGRRKRAHMNLAEMSVNRNQSILDALRLIDANRQGFTMVHDDDGRCAGVLTDGDIRRALINGCDLSDPVGEICNRNFSAIDCDTELSDVIRIFGNERIKFLPVLDREKHLVNVITKQDLYALLLQDIQPDVRYDFSEADTSCMDQDIVVRPWGFFRTTVLGDHFRTKIINVRPGAVLSLQSHKQREEHWVVVDGTGEVVLDESVKPVCSGSIIYIPKGCRHRIRNTAEQDSLIFIEVQQGDYLGEDDIIRYEDHYGRA